MDAIRTRTVALVLGVLAVGLTLISLKGYVDARHEIEELFDAQLARSARLLEGMVGADTPPATLAAIRDAMQRATPHPERSGHIGHRYENKISFVLFDADGRELLRSASAPPDTLASLARAVRGVDQTTAPAEDLAGFHNATLSDAHGWRLFLLPDEPDNLWILVGEREDVRGELVGKIARRNMLPDLVGLPLLALMVWLAIGWGLRPLARMVQLLRHRDPDSLSPLLLAPLPRELEPVAAALNRLLLQVNELLEREKRFLNDATHELRTPLAVLRIHVQNALEADDPGDRDDALRQLRGAIDRATRVVTQLLTLARLEPAAARLNMTRLDLAAFAREELAELAPLALARQQDISLDVAPQADCHLTADAASLGTLLQNLVTNAVQYTPPQGQILLQLESDAEQVTLRLLDSGPGVPAAARQHLTERFFRQDNSDGAGLGLSIVARVVDIHQGHICFTDSPLGGLAVVVVLPRSPRR
ncbi:sensory histidine protein kinase,two component [Isoalcanivorax pacificus W11-5]|jgi:two-component system, OmpR family, sensor histidine kinase QseC|uniref:histidine kinase n=1 Tax=Isoalcanivorax pacificus W11-5 TaxID=391936 RepID=A0A0B4XNZ5_9GAMM|nr:ATP-binding protein [Isoalcanivorax pacificus]AJD47997.1 sensory histidine protein kinase,two component [Isoalcanivorax pacificus W11-5]